MTQTSIVADNAVQNSHNQSILSLDLELVYSEYRDRVYQYIRSRTSSAYDAEDLLSAVFLEVTRKAHTYNPERASLSTWIYAITRNTVNFHLRGQYRAVKLVSYDDTIDSDTDTYVEDELDVFDSIIAEERLGRLAAALSSLPQRERDIIVLRFYYEKPSKEVASLMKLSNANVRYLQNKAVNKLRELMGER